MSGNRNQVYAEFLDAFVEFSNGLYFRIIRWFMPAQKSVSRNSRHDLIQALQNNEHHLQLLQDKLRQKQKKFKETFDNAAIGLAHLSLDGQWTRVNQALCDIVGYTETQMLSMRCQELTHPDDLPMTLEIIGALISGDLKRRAVEKRYLRSDGQMIWVKLHVALVRNDEGQPDYLVAVFENIDDRKLTETALAVSKRRQDIVLDAARLGVFDFFGESDPRNYWSFWVREHFGIDEHSPLSFARFVKLIHADDWPELEKTLCRCMATPDSRYHVEYRVIGEQDQKLRWIEASGQSFYDEQEKTIRLCGTTMDITARKSAQEEALRAALHDPLTGLPNRVLLFEYSVHIFDNAARHGHVGALLFIDLDRFKQVNDLHGHGVGDRLLVQVVDRIRRCLRSGDLVFRPGGDEFLVLMPEIARDEEGARVADRLVEALAEPYQIDGVEILISASIGISLFPRDGNDMHQLIQAADSAMYLAKQSGKNTWRFFSYSLSQVGKEALALQDRIRGALDRKEFELYFQPLVDLSDYSVCSVEALLRWPSAGIGPDKFIPAAEAVGQIVPIGNWVIDEACRTQRFWIEQGLAMVPIAVNVSALQFRQSGFHHMVFHQLQGSGLPASALQLELTESSLLEDLPHAIAMLQLLRANGIRISLDDFGTGYSSLSYLAQLPIDKIKVDKSFVHSVSSNKASRAVAEAIVAMAKCLKLEIVAEGVENIEMLHDMQVLGCGQIQGYLVARPMSAGEFVEAMKAGRLGVAPRMSLPVPMWAAS